MFSTIAFSHVAGNGITFDAFSYFGYHVEVRGVFFNLSKVFDKVWHESLLYKLKNNEINVNTLEPIDLFLHNRL